MAPRVRKSEAAFLGARAAPLPMTLAPMLARLASALPPDQHNWGFEFKWDGLRVLAFWDGRKLRLQSRNLLEVSAQYPEVAALAEVLGPQPLLLDGEVVAFDRAGQVSFAQLAHRMHRVRGGEQARQDVPLVYVIFDVLHRGGQSLLEVPYRERRRILDELALAGPAWRTTPYWPGEGAAVLEAAREHRLEGVMAKRLESHYEPGARSGAWLKVKLTHRQEFVVGGWTDFRGSDPRRLGALLLGYWGGPAGKQDPLRPGSASRLYYAGAVGTGFTSAEREELVTRLTRLRRATSPFADESRTAGAHWARPTLVAEIEHRGWTEHLMLRQAAYLGLREDQDPRTVGREDLPAAKEE